MNQEELLKEVKGALNDWHGMAIKLHITLVLLGSLSIISNLVITAFAGSEWLTISYIRVLSFVSTLSLTLLTAFSVSSKGNNAKKAWRHLNACLLRYYTGEADLAALAKCKAEGEEILGYVDFNANSLQRPDTKKSDP